MVCFQGGYTLETDHLVLLGVSLTFTLNVKKLNLNKKTWNHHKGAAILHLLRLYRAQVVWCYLWVGLAKYQLAMLGIH